METYQVLGLIGAILVIVIGIFMATLTYRFFYYYPYGGMMGFGMMMFLFPAYAIIPGALGLVGALINNRVASGILLILASFMSLPVFFGAFGIGFVLMLIGGILALTKT